MNKKTSLIVSLSFLIILFTSYYFASAATVGVPNPGHTWAEMECSASSICIDNSLNRVGIGTNNPAEKLHVNGNVSAAAYYYTSDVRLKDNILPIKNSLSKILKLEGISYTLQSTKEDKLGFSAQELQKIYPQLVKERNDGYLSIDGTGLIAPLVEAIKEQQNMIELQQVEINQLKEIINNLVK
ncbi:MAG: Hep_Hag family protein [Parcubacteria bacterium 33_209]|nr:MAG: Hep_Hag family protein [Parcubacteria bacterium 33_209]